MRSEVKLISVKTGDSLQKIESYCLSIEKRKSTVDIKLPRHMAYGGTLAIMPALLQFIGTWARSPKAGNLRFYVPFNDEAALDRVLTTPQGLVAAYMARGFSDSDVDRASLLRRASPMVRAMYSGDLKNTYKGQGVFLACFSGATNEYLIPFYQRPNIHGLRGTADFYKLTRSIARTCDWQFSNKVHHDVLQDISDLIRELVENANDHATFDETGRPYSWVCPSVRGLIARKTKIDSRGRKDVFQGDSSSSFSYLRTLLTSDQNSVSFLELTVFDLGPGIAKRWLAFEGKTPSLTTIDIAEEESIVRSVFEPGRSSKREGGTGLGLDAVVKSLTKLRAFVRLRSGRLCLRQDFSATPAVFDPEHDGFDCAQMSEVVGTTFSIMIPISLR